MKRKVHGLMPLQTAVSTALPTVTSSLNGKDFVWASSAYSLASTSLIPASGGLSEVCLVSTNHLHIRISSILQIFGRRPTMLLSIALFALGSALCGSAHNMAWFISGRGTCSATLQENSPPDLYAQ